MNESNTPYTIGHHRVYSYKPIDSWWCSRVLSNNKVVVQLGKCEPNA